MSHLELLSWFMMPSLMLLFAQPFRSLTLPPPGSFASQTVVRTGVNTGLGVKTACHIVNLGGPKVIFGVPAYSEGVTVKEDIEKSSVRTRVVDVRAFAARVGRLGRLNMAIMNAGLASG